MSNQPQGEGICPTCGEVISIVAGIGPCCQNMACWRNDDLRPESTKETSRGPGLSISSASKISDAPSSAGTTVEAGTLANSGQGSGRSLPSTMSPLEACQAILEMCAGWDEDGSLGPKPPYSWETVVRISFDYARAAVRGTPCPVCGRLMSGHRAGCVVASGGAS